VQQVQVKMICPEPPQTAVARQHRSPDRRIMGQHFADQEDIFTPALDCFPYQLFGPALGIHLGGVD
jgi:hypothetical protein